MKGHQSSVPICPLLLNRHPPLRLLHPCLLFMTPRYRRHRFYLPSLHLFQRRPFPPPPLPRHHSPHPPTMEVSSPCSADTSTAAAPPSPLTPPSTLSSLKPTSLTPLRHPQPATSSSPSSSPLISP